MNRKLVFALALTLLIGMLNVTFKLQRAKASGTIYIRADGLVDPPTAPITTVGFVTYTFTGNIYDSIVVEKDNIVVDGAGYRVQGTGEWGFTGITMIGRKNVTILNMEIVAWEYGIWLNSYSNYNNISVNNIHGTGSYGGGSGITLGLYCSNNVISGNNIADGGQGIGLEFGSSYNTIVGNNITRCLWWNALYIGAASNHNTISWNNITANGGYGIFLCDQYSNWAASAYNTISGNNIIANNDTGIMVDKSSHNIISGNNISGNIQQGIEVGFGLCINNSISGNTIMYNSGSGVNFTHYTSHNLVSGNNITNNANGIYLRESSWNSISRNNIANNGDGIYIYDDSNNNSISENNIAMNNGYGITLSFSSNNSIYHNNFVNNVNQVYVYGLVNIWDNGVEGSYWSNYTGADLNHDGVGDTPYALYANNIDRYPLMGMFHSFTTPYDYQVDIISNSSIPNFNFSLSTPFYASLTFSLTAETGTQGFCRVCIPKALINGSYVVRFNGEVITYPQVRELPCSNETYEYLYINYTHSEHTIEISGTTIIPEFPSFLVLPLFMIATLLAVLVYRRKHPR